MISMKGLFTKINVKAKFYSSQKLPRKAILVFQIDFLFQSVSEFSQRLGSKLLMRDSGLPLYVD